MLDGTCILIYFTHLMLRIKEHHKLERVEEKTHLQWSLAPLPWPPRPQRTHPLLSLISYLPFSSVHTVFWILTTPPIPPHTRPCFAIIPQIPKASCCPQGSVLSVSSRRLSSPTCHTTLLQVWVILGGLPGLLYFKLHCPFPQPLRHTLSLSYFNFSSITCINI